MLLYVAVSSVLLVTVSTFLILFQETRVKNQTIAEVEQQGQFVMETITQTIRNAESITSPGAGTSDTALELNVLDVADDPTTFDLSGDVLRITEGTGSAIDLTNALVSVSGLTFENLSRTGANDTVRIEFTISRDSNNTTAPYTYEKTFISSATVYAQ